MTIKAVIIAAINAKVVKYNLWRIGLTHDPAERKDFWTAKERTTSWTQWQADSLEEAQAIEAYFIGRGMKGGVGGDLSSRQTVYVYIF